MKYFIVLLIVILSACKSTPSVQNEEAPKELGPNEFTDGEYIMKQYYFVILKKGAKRDEEADTAYINDLQTRHLANIDRLADEGKILVAGPFGDDGDWRGIFIFDCPTQEEVETLLDTDPMIAAGWLGYEIHPWWTAKNEVFK